METQTTVELINPDSLMPSRGFAHAALVRTNRILYLAGQSRLIRRAPFNIEMTLADSSIWLFRICEPVLRLLVVGWIRSLS